MVRLIDVCAQAVQEIVAASTAYLAEHLPAAATVLLQAAPDGLPAEQLQMDLTAPEAEPGTGWPDAQMHVYTAKSARVPGADSSIEDDESLKWHVL